MTHASGLRPSAEPRPADVCRRLLAALDAADGRRRRRKRDTTPDAIGLGIKRRLLEGIVAADPAPDALEAWLVARCAAEPGGQGAWRAMAQDVIFEWQLAASFEAFDAWLAQGAPSDDARA